MMKIDIYKIDGTKSGDSVELSDEIFGIEPNDHVIYLSVKAYLANQRQGTAKTKERWEVSGGGKKPWKQKGRGVARSGSTRSPIWVGGGTIFGPKPRNYREKLNKKVKRLALKSAYSSKAKANQVVVVEDFSFDSPKTKDFSAILNSLSIAGKKTLILTTDNAKNVYQSGRNIDRIKVLEAKNASPYDVLNNQILLLQKGALEQVENTLK